MTALRAGNLQYESTSDFSVIEPDAFESDGLWVSAQEVWQVLVGVDRSGGFPGSVPEWTGLLNAFLPILIVSFLVTLFTVPIVRWLAVKFDIVDHPDGGRKVHSYPVAYLGGMAVFIGLLGGIFASYILPTLVSAGGNAIVSEYSLVPFAITAGMFTIFLTGMFDDIFHWDPRLKIAGGGRFSRAERDWYRSHPGAHQSDSEPLVGPQFQRLVSPGWSGTFDLEVGRSGFGGRRELDGLDSLV